MDQPARGACLLGCGRPRRMNMTIGSARLSNAVSRMSPRLRLNWGGSRGTLRTSVYLATYCVFERIDELACVVALLARSPLENSSPVHPATHSLLQFSVASCVTARRRARSKESVPYSISAVSYVPLPTCASSPGLSRTPTSVPEIGGSYRPASTAVSKMSPNPTVPEGSANFGSAGGAHALRAMGARG